MLNENEITFSPERDGYPGVPLAFVIDGEVVYTKSFKPSFAEEYMLKATNFESIIINDNGQNKEVIIIQVENSNIQVEFSEVLTSILLSEPKIIKLTLENGKHVSVGWKHDEKGFYINTTINSEAVRYNGNGSYGE